MKLKELVTVIDPNAYLNSVSDEGYLLYGDKVIFITTED